MNIAQFVEDVKADLANPASSNFSTKFSACRMLAQKLDEGLEADRATMRVMKKSVASLHQSGKGVVTCLEVFAKGVEGVGGGCLKSEPVIGNALVKFSSMTKELSNISNNLMNNLNNMLLFPVECLLKNDMKAPVDLKKNCDEAYKDYKTKESKYERDQRKKAGEIILYKLDNYPELETARRVYQYHMCEYLAKISEVKVKKGVDLFARLIDIYNQLVTFFNESLRLLESMRSCFDQFSVESQQIRLKQEDERKDIVNMRNLLKQHLPPEKSDLGVGSEKKSGYSLHGQQGNKNLGTEKSGYLLKRSEGVRKVWQKRWCVLQGGLFTIAHSSTDRPTAFVPLLTCQVKEEHHEDKKAIFSLMTHNRKYLFLADDEMETNAWISVLSNSREEELKKAFKEDVPHTDDKSKSVKEICLAFSKRVQRMLGNEVCVDCGARDPSWVSSNLGILMCIECSGIHREMGVHVSRISSLTLDVLGTSELLVSSVIGNSFFNEIMEANADLSKKITPSSTMEQRKDYITAKYLQKRFASQISMSPDQVSQELAKAVRDCDMVALLQLFAAGTDLCSPLQDGSTSLHKAVQLEDGTSLYIIDFIAQNGLDIDVIDAEGDTPLHIACQTDKLDCAKLLLRAGASLFVANKKGKLPTDIANERGNKEMVELIREVSEGKTTNCKYVKVDLSALQNESCLFDLQYTDGEYHLPADQDDLASSPTRVNAPVLVSPCVSTESTFTVTPESKTTVNLRNRHSIAQFDLTQEPYRDESSPARNLVTHRKSGLGLQGVLQSTPKNVFKNESLVRNTTRTHKLSATNPPQIGDCEVPSNHSLSYTALNAPELGKSGSRENRGGSTSSQPPPIPFRKPKATGPLFPESSIPPYRSEHDLRNINRTEYSPGFKLQQAKLPVEVQSPVIVPEPPSLPRALALYDCYADRDDELTFHRGEIIIITDYLYSDSWWMGHIEGEPERSGLFPKIFVRMVDDVLETS